MNKKYKVIEIHIKNIIDEIYYILDYDITFHIFNKKDRLHKVLTISKNFFFNLISYFNLEQKYKDKKLKKFFIIVKIVQNSPIVLFCIDDFKTAINLYTEATTRSYIDLKIDKLFKLNIIQKNNNENNNLSNLYNVTI